MGKQLYTWEQVVAYSVIALNNLKHSANEINIKNLKLFIEPLKNLHSKDTVIEYSQKLIHTEK